jgi:hypothetical protein
MRSIGTPQRSSRPRSTPRTILDDTLAAAARGLAAAGGAPTIASPAALIFPGQDEINLSASAGRLHGNRNLGERRPVQQQIERKGGAEQRRQVAIGATGKQAHLRPRSVDHPGGARKRCARSVTRSRASTPALLPFSMTMRSTSM